jgi:hypothetical protein
VTSRHLAMLGLYVNRLLAAGTHDHIDIGVVSKRANHGELFTSLEAALGKEADLWWVSPDARAELNAEWAGMRNAISLADYGLDDRSRGLHLVMVLILESIQQRALGTHVESDE